VQNTYNLQYSKHGDWLLWKRGAWQRGDEEFEHVPWPWMTFLDDHHINTITETFKHSINTFRTMEQAVTAKNRTEKKTVLWNDSQQLCDTHLILRCWSFRYHSDDRLPSLQLNMAVVNSCMKGGKAKSRPKHGSGNSCFQCGLLPNPAWRHCQTFKNVSILPHLIRSWKNVTTDSQKAEASYILTTYGIKGCHYKLKGEGKISFSEHFYTVCGPVYRS
jgi:zona occludens toxin (predicted ATPase)